jgi:hypothetical protein
MKVSGRRTVIASRDYWAEKQAVFLEKIRRPQTPVEKATREVIYM